MKILPDDGPSNEQQSHLQVTTAMATQFLRRLSTLFLCITFVSSLLRDHTTQVSKPTLDDADHRRTLQSPHSGRHFVPSHPAYRNHWFRRRRRFTEGWYYRLTIPNVTSFAFIFSIEDPGYKKSRIRLACAQVIGPNGGYLVQGSRDDTAFWASKKEAAFGCTFVTKRNTTTTDVNDYTELKKDEWDETVESGFQITPLNLLGRIHGKDGTVGAILDDSSGEKFACEFDIEVEPTVGWGGTKPQDQRSTAGWLASFPVFEPHWQILLADAKASGRIVWKNITYEFKDAKFYAEKNWGKHHGQLEHEPHSVISRCCTSTKMVLDAMQFISGV